MYTFLKKYHAHFLYSVLTLGSIYLCFESISKGIFLIIIFTIWYVLSIKKKNTLTTLPLLLFVIPFNITLQIFLPSTNPYVSGFWVNYLIPTLSIIDVFVVLLLIQLTFLVSRNTLTKLFKDRYLLLLLALFIIQALIVQDIASTIMYTRIFVYLLTSILLTRYIKESGYIKRVLQNRYTNYLLLSTILIQGAVGIYQFVRGTSLGVYFLGESEISSGMVGSSSIDIQGELFLRSYGTFPHPNVLAGWYLFTILLTLFLYSKSKNKVFLLTTGISAILLIFTFSRVSLLLLLLIPSIFIFKERKLFSFTSLLYYRFLNIFNQGDNSLSDRIELIKVNVEIFKENILLGTGLGNSLRFYSGNIPFTQGGKLLLQPVHNIWILNFVELGILLGIYYLYILFRYFVKGIKLNGISISILLFIFLIGMFDHYLFTLPQGNIILFSSLILLSDSR